MTGWPAVIHPCSGPGREEDNSRAHALYERLGYVAHGREPDAWDEHAHTAPQQVGCLIRTLPPSAVRRDGQVPSILGFWHTSGGDSAEPGSLTADTGDAGDAVPGKQGGEVRDDDLHPSFHPWVQVRKASCQQP